MATVPTIGDEAAKANLYVEQGSEFRKKFIVPTAALLISDYATARMKAKQTHKSAGTLLDLTTANGGLILDTGDNSVTVVISTTASEVLDWTVGVYDLELVTALNVVRRLMQGIITISQNVTD